MLEKWQILPYLFQPTVELPGGFSITWYALCYIAGVLLSVLFFVSLSRRKGLFTDSAVAIECMVTVLWGVIIGARLGYVFFYGGSEYWLEPWRIISPYDFSLGEWVGIRGMSFHGGLIGGAIALFLFAREGRRNFLAFSDIVVQAVPIGLFFGRLGNFLNQELWGRVTERSWGVYFPGQENLRHPVTLYEAFLEGVVLFSLLFWLSHWKRSASPGFLSGIFLVGYAIFRCIAEVYREPTVVLFGGMLTLGQGLSLGMGLIGVFLLIFSSRRMV